MSLEDKLHESGQKVSEVFHDTKEAVENSEVIKKTIDQTKEGAEKAKNGVESFVDQVEGITLDSIGSSVKDLAGKAVDAVDSLTLDSIENSVKDLAGQAKDKTAKIGDKIKKVFTVDENGSENNDTCVKIDCK